MIDSAVQSVLDGSRPFALVEGDAALLLPTLPPASVHAVVTDPPSGIGFMGLAFDHHRGGRAAWVEWLADILTSARAATIEGGRLLCWSLPRTSHWTGCAVEDAGWSMESHVLHLFGQGWPKGRSQLKPAHELWWLARNGRGTPLNIDECRVGTEVTQTRRNGDSGGTIFGRDERVGEWDNPPGRWPPTVAITHTPWCTQVGTRRVSCSSPTTDTGSPVTANAYGATGRRSRVTHNEGDGFETVTAWDCAPGCPAVAVAVAVASGERRSGSAAVVRTLEPDIRRSAYGHECRPPGTECVAYGDTGTALRFFPQFEDETIITYHGKVAPSERWVYALCGCGPRVMPMGSRRATCPTCQMQRVVSAHPTTKSLGLMRWLIRLVTRPGDIVLDPFAGSGTTGVAALAEGRRFVGVEEHHPYAAIARARLANAAARPDIVGQARPLRPALEAPETQLDLFARSRA